jgi:HNH endonuclease
MARGTCLTREPVRNAVRWLVDLGALRLIRRSKKGHLVEARVPGEIRAARFDAATVSERVRLPDAVELEEIDFMQTKILRRAIDARECGRCFYGLRRLAATTRCLDHVVPRAQSGPNSYRNLVSACLERNSHKGEKPAENFLRWLYRERRLIGEELAGRVRALDALARGKLRPEVKEVNKQGDKKRSSRRLLKPKRDFSAQNRRGGEECSLRSKRRSHGLRDIPAVGKGGDAVGGAEGQGFDGQCGLAASRGDQAAAVAQEEILDVVGAVIRVDHGSLGVVAHAARAQQMHAE